MADAGLESDVVDALGWDPRIDSAAIAVSAAQGVVTLRGRVGSLRQRCEAQRVAERISGVSRVDNELALEIMVEHRRDDAELNGDVLQALMLDSVIPSTVGAAVRAGLVILLGTAQWQFQRREAEFVAANVLGVVGIENSIRLRAAVPTAHDVEHSIMRALGRDCLLAGRTLSVRGSDGVVTLRGTIASWAERDAAVDAAWAAPGVIHVNDRLTVR